MDDSETLVGSTVNGISSCKAAAMDIGATQVKFRKITAVLVDSISVLVKGSVAKQPFCSI